VACQAHRSHAWHGEDATALESKAATVGPDGPAPERANSPGRAVPALGHRTPAGRVTDSRQGCRTAGRVRGCLRLAAGTPITGNRTTESNFVRCWAACRVSAHRSSALRDRREKERKKHLSFSLIVLGTQRGEEGLDKDPILDCLISKAPFKPEAAQVQPELRVFPSLPACRHPGMGREGTGHSSGSTCRGILGKANCQLRPGQGALQPHTSAGAWAMGSP